MISKEHFDRGMDEFHRKRDPQELDLVHEVRVLLNKSNIGDVPNCYDSHDLIKMTSDKTPDVQRHFLNRYWSFQLANASANDTFEARFSLIPNGPVEDWLRLFEEKVLPVCVKYQLPK